MPEILRDKRWNVNPTAWASHAVPELDDWFRKLAATSSYDERKWRELSRGKWEAKHHGIGDVSEMRPAPLGEGTKPSIPKSWKDNKRKRVSNPEDLQDKKTPARRLRKRFAHVDADPAHDSPDDKENDGAESALVTRTKKSIETAKPSELETSSRGEETSKKDTGKAPVFPEVEIVPPPSINIPEGASAKALEANQNAPSEELGAMTTGHSLSLPSYSEEATEDANALRMPDPSKVLEEDPFQGCFAGVEDTSDLNDVSTIFEKAQHLLSQAKVKFRAELSQCEAELRKVSGEEKALRILCSQKEEELKDLQAKLAKARKNEAEPDEQLWGEVDQVKADCHRWKKNIDQLAADKEAITAQLTSAETQLRGIKAKGLAQARKIEELEVELARARAEAAQTKAEVEKTKATADKAIAVETLEEIHARGFDLTEEIAEAKAQETDARFLVSFIEEDVVSGSEGGEGEEGASEEEGVPEDKAAEDTVPEDGAGDVTPKILVLYFSFLYNGPLWAL
ncbi:PREDICTED: inner centromere protein B-like [Nicotiana attenuata]|uniref:inner centromere protein B-like n=1 Tax=Nicotiana attenuata TaxID=49451 RepID=UPI000904D672|nr:PREDICTED: inner centromere protein B-like [Nicotiana attenuata]